jgi:hypothetical protein
MTDSCLPLGAAWSHLEPPCVVSPNLWISMWCPEEGADRTRLRSSADVPALHNPESSPSFRIPTVTRWPGSSPPVTHGTRTLVFRAIGFDGSAMSTSPTAPVGRDTLSRIIDRVCGRLVDRSVFPSASDTSTAPGPLQRKGGCDVLRASPACEVNIPQI